MTTLAPPQNIEQRWAALARANETRSARARAKHDWLSLTPTLAAEAAARLVVQIPDWALTWRVREVLLALPKVGPVRVHRIFLRAGISETKTLGGLSERQRAEVLTWLEALA